VKINLENIKATKGVENAVLTQRDGNPIQYSGIWLSKNEIFSVSAATSAIYNCGLQLHGEDLKYILIEGTKSKIILSPLRNYGNPTLNKIISAQKLQGSDNEFFIAITTQPTVNLGGILLKTRKSLIDIKKGLILSGESFKPPLRHFSQEELKKLLDSFNVKDDLKKDNKIEVYSTNISHSTYNELNSILKEFGNQTLDLINTFVTLDGGFVTAHYTKENNPEMYILDAEAMMSHSLFLTADNCAWLLKKMHINSILLECNNSFQFINKVGKGIFSTQIAKGRQKLGLLRLIIPRFCKRIALALEKNKSTMEHKLPTMDFKSMFSELIF
jgi:predicted regulator of Ras-like GTPase activity (Roadblock/LC7/MglB family)